MKRTFRFATRMMACGAVGLIIGLGSLCQPVSAQDGDRPAEEREVRRGPPEGRGPQADGRGPRGPRGPRDGARGFDGPPGGGPMRGPQMLMRLPVIAALDANRDGEISASEIENATAALKKLDHNKDGKLDLAEMRPTDFGPPEGGRGDFGARRGGPPEGPPRGPRDGDFGDRPRGSQDRGPRGADQGDPDGPPRDRGFRGAEGRRGGGMFARGNPEEMIERMMDQDKDGDGSLSAEELPQFLSRMMERADQNGDKKLSREELENMMKARMGAGRGRGGPPRDGDTPGGERPRRPPAE